MVPCWPTLQQNMYKQIRFLRDCIHIHKLDARQTRALQWLVR
jgi:hypothetical protein